MPPYKFLEQIITRSQTGKVRWFIIWHDKELVTRLQQNAWYRHVAKPLFIEVPMAPSRRARDVQENAQPLYTDDTDPENESTTPKAHRKPSRKRLSDVHGGDGDGSFIAEGRAPLAAISINDDAAEKRKRRKSTKITIIDDIQAGVEGQDANNAKLTKQKQQLNSVAPPAAINVPLDVMSSNYEEWMKLATDNVCGW